MPGHLLRAQRSWDSFSPADEKRFDVVVVGGGISGLSAAWKLGKAGVERLLVLELEAELGGTSLSGGNGVDVFPWAAHYINIPPREADCVHEMLLDLGVIEGYDAQGRPRVVPDCLLRWPHERLFIGGRWVEGLDPFVDAGEREMETLRAFEDDMLRWTLYRGRDGRRAFAMPLRYSTREEKVRALDSITMEAYVRFRGWASERLDWLIDYGCRDDYGSMQNQVSAWAGIHYWACRFYDRRVRDEYPPDTLTWAEGNAFLARNLAERTGAEYFRTRCPVVRIAWEKEGARIWYMDLASGETHTLSSRTVVFAGKLHTAPFVVEGLPEVQRRIMAGITYSPWLVAAIYLSSLPQESGIPMAWDNVFFNSASLGYVRTDHQSLREDGKTVLVYYHPFVEEVDKVRGELLRRPHQHWVQAIMTDLLTVHPDLEGRVERIDVYRWGHAMVRPTPGVIWGDESRWRAHPLAGISFATCDATGLPLFEEAVFAGVQAAEQCLSHLDVNFSTSLEGLADA